MYPVDGKGTFYITIHLKQTGSISKKFINLDISKKGNKTKYFNLKYQTSSMSKREFFLLPVRSKLPSDLSSFFSAIL